MSGNYYVYILTNHTKTVLYIGITNNPTRRIEEHKANPKEFAYKYKAFLPVLIEHFVEVNDAIAFEKKLKGWTRKKKIDLINSRNPEWKNLLST